MENNGPRTLEDHFLLIDRNSFEEDIGALQVTVNNSNLLHVTHRSRDVTCKLQCKNRRKGFFGVVDEGQEVQLVEFGGNHEVGVHGVTNELGHILVEGARPHDGHLLKESLPAFLKGKFAADYEHAGKKK